MIRIEVWIATILITAGVSGAVIYNVPLTTTTEPGEADCPAVAKSEPAKDAGKGKPSASQLTAIEESSIVSEPLVVELATDQVEQGDQYLVVGNFNGAQRAYIKATHKFHGDAPAPLLFRLAMVAEQLSDVDSADSLYQKAVRRSASGSMIRLLSLTGVARAWQERGQFDQAQQLLSELFLRYASGKDLDDEIKLQITYQLSTVIQRQVLKNIPQPRETIDAVEFKWCGPSIDAMLDIATQEQETGRQLPQRDQANGPVWKVLQRPSSDLNLIAVDTIVPLTPVNAILAEYARLTKIEFDIAPAAKRSISGRSVRLDVTAMPLALVLDHLLWPLGLAWSQDGDQVSIQQIDKDDSRRQVYQLQRAKRLLRNIELSFARGPRRDTSLLHQGNLSLLNQEVGEAENRYLELEKLAPNDELSAKLSFNIALVKLANDLPEEAIKRLFYSVDQSLDQTLQSKCYAWIGRLELQSGHPDRAVYALSRCLALASEAQIRQDALMNLTKSFLLESDPFSANRVLFNNTSAVVDPSQQRLAAVLSAYARFLGMVPSEGLRNEGERLVVALAFVVPEDTNAFVDKLLVGRAFYEVGFATRSNSLLEQALEQAPHHSWRRRVAFELGTNQHRAGELDAAERTFATIVSGATDETSLLAKFHLAEISLAKKQPERCLEICKQLHQQELSDEQQRKMLSMMGTAYRSLNRHELAAICFSGSVPQAFNEVNVSTSPSGVRSATDFRSDTNNSN